jgi:5-methylcytosine-specific restriction endonuclease McrA
MAPYACADPLATSHLSHRDLLQDFDTRVASNHSSFVILLTRIAEIDERRLYLDEGFPTMKAFLVQRMRLFTDHSAEKRLTAARTARKYPGVLVALYDGRLSQRAVLMLAPRLTPANANELVAAALDKTCFELQVVLAERFPQPDLPQRLEIIAAPAPPHMPTEMLNPPAPGRVDATIPHFDGHTEVPPLAAQPVEVPRARVVPLAPQRFGFQFTGDQETHELYEDFRALVSHEVPTGEMALVFKEALKIARAQLMKHKCAATDRPRPTRGSANPGHIPAAERRKVWERDQGRCAFVSEAGKRCGSRRGLDCDHVVLKARGGPSTADNLRLLCSAHNQHAAERELGAEFMERKRAARGSRPRVTGTVRDGATGEPLE